MSDSSAAPPAPDFSRMLRSVNHITIYLRSHASVRIRSTDSTLKRAAVLVPLVLENDRLCLLLTKRTESVEHHKGQISFPGGTVDSGDADAAATALREAEEEIGLNREAVEILGLLDDLEIPTGFVVTPVVGLLRGMPDLVLNVDEVEEAFCVPVGFFLDEANEEVGEREWRGRKLPLYSYQFGAHRIWGATAAVIRRFLRGVSDSTR